jgi:hypothetical protein
MRELVLLLLAGFLISKEKTSFSLGRCFNKFSSFERKIIYARIAGIPNVGGSVSLLL